MERRRKRIPASVNAALFAISFFAIAMIFANDWMESHREIPKFVASAPVEKKEAPEAVAEEKPNVEEPAPKIEDPPAVAAVEEPAAVKPPGEDPWAVEKARVAAAERRRQNGFVQIDPQVLFKEMRIAGADFGAFDNRFAIPDVRVFAGPAMIDPEELFDRLRMPELRAFNRQGMIDPQAQIDELRASATARRVASEVQALFFSSVPESRQLVARFDVAPADGRLVVNVRDAFVEFDPKDRRTVMEAIAEVWRETKFTRQHKCSKTVEFRSRTGWTETLEM